jgi:hypothetical protein
LDNAGELGGILNLVLRLGENLAQHAGLAGELAQHGDVMHFKLRAFQILQRGP